VVEFGNNAVTAANESFMQPEIKDNCTQKLCLKCAILAG